MRCDEALMNKQKQKVSGSWEYREPPEPHVEFLEIPYGFDRHTEPALPLSPFVVYNSTTAGNRRQAL
jgi:hypothetical protein